MIISHQSTNQEPIKNLVRTRGHLIAIIYFRGNSILVTDAEFAILALYEARIAVAVIAADRVYASAVRTDAFLLALVPVLALIGLGISRLPLGALANKRAGSVQALPTLAKPGNCFALVDI